MRRITLLVVLLVSVSQSFGKKLKPASTIGFPATFTISTFPPAGSVPVRDRFSDPVYFRFMASDGLLSVDPKNLYGRIQAAAQAHETYKALYLAHVLSRLKPDSAAVWANEAALASSLGLVHQAELCRKNASDPTHAVAVTPELLPGSAVKYRPASLADWAAALALMSDSISAKESPGALIAVKDDVSGIDQATQQEIDKENESRQSLGLPPTGPWARPQPIKSTDVLSGAFSLRNGDPMSFRSGSRGGFASALLLGGLAGMQANSNPVAASQTEQAAQREVGRAAQVPSHYHGGSYVAATYASANANGEASLITEHPQPSGEDDAVGSPQPVLWASGDSFTPVFTARVIANTSESEQRITPKDLRALDKVKARLHKPPSVLHFPKLMTLCANQQCTYPVTVIEALLTRADVALLSPSLADRFPDVHFLDSQFVSGQVTLSGTLINRYAGYDDDGNTYIFELSPTTWILPLQERQK